MSSSTRETYERVVTLKSSVKRQSQSSNLLTTKTDRVYALASGDRQGSEMHRSTQGGLAPPSRSQTPAPGSNPSSGQVPTSLSGYKTWKWTNATLFNAPSVGRHDAKSTRFAKFPQCRNSFEMLPFWSLVRVSPWARSAQPHSKRIRDNMLGASLDSQATCHL